MKFKIIRELRSKPWTATEDINYTPTISYRVLQQSFRGHFESVGYDIPTYEEAYKFAQEYFKTYQEIEVEV